MLVMQTELLPAIDQKRLATLEREIDSAVKSFITAGNALREIRDGRLYQETHETFEAYCKERWSFSRPRAYQLIEAAGTNQRLSKILDTPPTTESHTVEVAKAPEDKQAEVWQAACERAEDAGKPVTAKIIKETREELLAEPEPSKTPDSDGLFDTSDLGAEDETAVITELVKRLTNSSRTVLSCPIRLGDRPMLSHPFHFGVKSHQGIMLPFITSGASLKLVVTVQKIGKRQTKVQIRRMA